MSAIIPGKYTHVLAYIGKDDGGYAYAIEINIDKNQTFSLNHKGLNIGGKLHLFCLGADFSTTSCPNDTYAYGIKAYDYMWAKRLNPKLKKQLLEHKGELIATIKKDLTNRYPFKLPFNFNAETSLSKTLPFIVDTHQNGSDCVSYFVSLFEKVAKIHFDDITMSSSELISYYLYDPIGKEAILPKKYNPITDKDTYIKDLIENLGYTFIDETGKGALLHLIYFLIVQVC